MHITNDPADQYSRVFAVQRAYVAIVLHLLSLSACTSYSVSESRILRPTTLRLYIVDPSKPCTQGTKVFSQSSLFSAQIFT